MLGLSLWEGRLPGQKTIENEDKAAMGSYRPESNFGTSDTVLFSAVNLSRSRHGPPEALSPLKARESPEHAMTTRAAAKRRPMAMPPRKGFAIQPGGQLAGSRLARGL